MKKFVLGAVVVGVIVVAGGLYYVFTNINAIVEAAIETYGSQTTQTKVRVDKVKIMLTDGAGTISGLTVANPKGFGIPNILSLGEISTRVNIESLTTDVIVIDKIIVRELEVFYEMTEDRKTNLDALLVNVNKAVPSSGTSKSQDTGGNGKPIKLRIRRLQFSEGTIQAKVAPLKDKQYELKLPRIDVRDLGGSRGATPEQISQQIISIVLDRARARVKQEITDKYLSQHKDAAKAKIEAEKAAVTEKVETKAKDKLKGLLGR